MPVSAQLRRLVARYGTVIAVALAIGGLVMLASAGNVYLNPPTSTETSTTDRQSFGAEVETSAVVTGNTTLYPEGRELRNMPVYFFNASEDLTYHVRASTPEGVETTVTQRLVLHLEATRDGDPFWEHRRVLATGKTTTSDGVAWTNSTVNMSAVRALVAEKRNAIGEVGTFTATHELNVTYASPQYEGTLTASAPLVTTQRAFWLGGDVGASDSRSRTTTRTVTGSPNVTLVALMGLGGLALLGAAAVVVLRSREYDLQSIDEEIARAQYSEWISNGEIPTKSGKEYIRVDSIDDVVDVAIDSNKRVIYDRDLDVYAVVEGDLVYFYTTDTEEITDWLDV